MTIRIKTAISVSNRQKPQAKSITEMVRRDLLGKSMVKVGFPKGQVAGDLITIAYWNHEGTNRQSGDVFFKNGKFGISGPIPPRPFITMAMFKARGKLRAFMRAEAKAIVNGKRNLEQSLARLGMMAQDAIQMQIGSNMDPANSPMTIELKGSSRTLVDSGRMMASVTWEIVK